MPWIGDLIYTKPKPKIIKHFSSVNGFSDNLFWVNDLEGITFDFVRSFMLSDEPNEKSYMKHTFPKEGLLAIKPERSQNPKFFPTGDWSFINSVSATKLDISLDLTENQLKLLGYLKVLNAKFRTPILYYYCVMWGGEVELEYAIVFDDKVRVFVYDPEKKKDFEHTGKEKVELESGALQTGLKHLGLELPTWFFALHESSFDWSRYHLKMEKT